MGMKLSNVHLFLFQKYYDDEFFETEATKWGKAHEMDGVQGYETSRGKTTQCGIFINKAKPYYAATPDRITKDIIIEVKCPFSIRKKDPNLHPPYYCKLVDGKLQLKKTHEYFFQVQLQLYVTGYKKADFVV